MKNNAERKEEKGQILIRMFENDIGNYIIYTYLNTKAHTNTDLPKHYMLLLLPCCCFSETKEKNLLLKTTQNSNIGFGSVEMHWN